VNIVTIGKWRTNPIRRTVRWMHHVAPDLVNTIVFIFNGKCKYNGIQVAR
jgi:ribosomal protein S19